MFTIDGLTWDIPCDIDRVMEVRPSDISGLLMDKTWFNDVLGTYLRYSVTLAANPDDMTAYYQIMETLNAPVDGHAFVLPYNESTIQITARVENVRDVYVMLPGGATYWKGTKFDVIANGPTKEQALGEVIARGMSPLPDVSGPREGDIYIYTNGAWTPYTAPSYADADDMQF